MRWHASMIDLDGITAACGIIYTIGEQGFRHVATAWSVGTGEWISACLPDDVELHLLTARDGTTAAIDGIERDGEVAGFTSHDVGCSLSVGDEPVRKREQVSVVGYPTVIDHPSFRLHRGSLDHERYYPYLCPWAGGGHLSLFSKDFGYATVPTWPGMNGSPVFGDDGRVVGVVLSISQGEPPLTRFQRLTSAGAE